MQQAPDTISPMNLPSGPARLSVSIVLHNSCLDMLQRVLGSLQDSAGVAREAGLLHSVAVMLVDNASQTAYRSQLTQLVDDWPQDDGFSLQSTLLSGNGGFGHGHNTAIASLRSDYHLILNPDVELEPDALSAGLSHLGQNASCVLLSPMAYGPGGEQEFLCKLYPSVLVLLLRGFAPRFLRHLFRGRLAAYEMREECSGERPVSVAIASGCFMLVRTPVLRDSGGFDEGFFLYFEDFDLSLRLQEWGSLAFDPATRIVHHGGYAASKGWQHLRYFVSSGIRFFNCHGWRWI